MNTGEIIISKNEDGLPAIDVEMQNDVAWLTQQQMFTPFGKTKQNISLHIKEMMIKVITNLINY